MKIARKSLKAGIAVFLTVASLNVAGCGKRPALNTLAPTPAPMATPDPSYTDPGYSNPGYDDRNSYTNVPTGVPNSQIGSFKVDQDMLHSWQARGIAVAGGTIYVSAADAKGLSKKGTIVKMNSSDGKSWKDLAGSLLGMRHPIDSTVKGIAISGGSIIALDSTSKFYIVDAAKGSVKTVKTAGGSSVAAGGGSVFFANGMVEKSDSSASSRMPINTLNASGGICADNQGNVYAISGNSIKKADPQGMVQDLVTSDLAGPSHIAVDNRAGDIYVMEGTMIKRFTTSGQFVISFSSGAGKPVGIAVDETGSLYIADEGTSSSDSKVIKFAPSTDAAAGINTNMNGSSYGGYGNSSSAYGAGSYGSYSAPSTTTNKRVASTL